jgi:hypothetical protein
VQIAVNQRTSEPRKLCGSNQSNNKKDAKELIMKIFHNIKNIDNQDKIESRNEQKYKRITEIIIIKKKHPVARDKNMAIVTRLVVKGDQRG